MKKYTDKSTLDQFIKLAMKHKVFIWAVKKGYESIPRNPILIAIIDRGMTLELFLYSKIFTHDRLQQARQARSDICFVTGEEKNDTIKNQKGV